MRKRDAKVDLRIAEPLLAELQLVADAEGRTVSDVCRRALIEQLWLRRNSERGQAA